MMSKPRILMASNLNGVTDLQYYYYYYYLLVDIFVVANVWHFLFQIHTHILICIFKTEPKYLQITSNRRKLFYCFQKKFQV